MDTSVSDSDDGLSDMPVRMIRMRGPTRFSRGRHGDGRVRSPSPVRPAAGMGCGEDRGVARRPLLDRSISHTIYIVYVDIVPCANMCSF